MVPGLDTYRIDKIVKGPEFSQYYGLKKRIAVLDFENRTDYNSKKMGGAITDLLISQLTKSGRFIILERSKIEQIMREQALGQSGIISEETAAQVGQLLGVESIIMGNLLEASEETDSRKIDNKKNNWGLALKATVGTVQVSYRMVNTTTGEIILADDFSASEIRPGFGLETKKFDFNNMFDFDQTVLGIAVRKVVNKMALQITNNVEKIEWTGKVVQSKADTLIYFTPGRGAGINVGQQFNIFKKRSEAPEDLEIESEILSLPDNKVKAKIEVSGFIGDKVSRAKVISGENIQRGDIVKHIKGSQNIRKKNKKEPKRRRQNENHSYF